MTVLDHLQELLDESVRRSGVPGASVAVLWDGRVHEAASGVINVATGVPCTTDAVFPFGSVTKTVTSTAALRLVDAGKLDLDAPVTGYVAEFQPKDHRLRDMRIRHLLTHTSGLVGTIFVDTGRNADALSRQIEKLNDVPAYHLPGQLLSYCNSGMLLLGRAIEVVTGTAWEEAVQELVARPLGIGSIVTRPEAALRWRTAVGHLFNPNEKRWLVEPHPFMLPGHGPAGSTMAGRARDLITLASAYLDEGRAFDGSVFLKPDTVSTAWEVQAKSPAPFTVVGYGLGWAIYDWHGRKLIGHDGATAATKAFLRVLPEQRLAVALLVNAPPGLLVYEDVMGEVFRGLAGTRERMAPEMPALPNDALQHCVGTFEDCHVRVEVESTVTGAQLMITPNASHALMRPQTLRYPIQAFARDAFFTTGRGVVVYEPIGEVDCNLVLPFQLVTVPAEGGEEFLYSRASAYRRVASAGG
jgi:CubicO group peptidase (beta-lactamase class C family)